MTPASNPVRHEAHDAGDASGGGGVARAPRVLYVALRYDYGRPEQGYAYEHWNFFHALRAMGCDVTYFDVGTLLRRRTRAGAADLLRALAQERGPDGRPSHDLMLAIPFTDELDRDCVRAITADSGVATCAWFCDDHWRFESFTARWCGAFGLAVTTARSALPKYAALGHPNVLRSQWACNHYLYTPAPGRPVGDAPARPGEGQVAFVGLPHGTRRRMIEALRGAGVGVRCCGLGWEALGGERRLSQEAMIELFRTAPVTLNLANTSSQRWPRSPQERLAAIAENQIKGRVFEVPGCGGVLLTEVAEDLECCYTPGVDVETFQTPEEMIDRARALLASPQRRRALARAGLGRTLREHTWNHRFTEIFRRLGLAWSPPLPTPDQIGAALEGRWRAEATPGRVRMVE
jgi:spore maturation protein CgeB